VSGVIEVLGLRAASQPIVGKPDSYALRAEAALWRPQVIAPTLRVVAPVWTLRVLWMTRSVRGFITTRSVGTISISAQRIAVDSGDRSRIVQRHKSPLIPAAEAARCNGRIRQVRKCHHPIASDFSLSML
jgi:hypothetical protein